jgi:hypothetical protein
MIATPQEFSFRIEKDDDVGLYFQFTYLGSSDYDDVWDDLEDIINSNLESSLCRIEESSYEPQHDDLNYISEQLRRLRFKG